MEVLEAHRERVQRLREQYERMRYLRQAIYDAREESWDLRTHWEAARDARINELHEQIDAMAEEVELIREAHFGAAVTADRMGHALSVPERVLGEEAPPPAKVKSAAMPRPATVAYGGLDTDGGLDGLMVEATADAAEEEPPATLAEEGLDALMAENEADAEPAEEDDMGALADLAEAEAEPQGT